MFPRDAATGSRRAASMYDDYYDYDYGHGLEAVRQAAQAIPLPPAYGTKAKVHIGYGVSLLYCITRKYPLRGYILGVLTHTTALDRLWGGDGTLTMWF